MYSIKLYNEKYFSGEYASYGQVEGGISIATLPPLEDLIKAKFYYYDFTNEIWILDEIKYNQYLEDEANKPHEKTLEEKVASLESYNNDLEDAMDAILTTILPQL